MKFRQHQLHWLAIILLGLTLLLPASAPLAAGITDQDIANVSNDKRQEPSGTATIRNSGAPSLPGLMGKLTMALAVVFGLMAVVLWAARRYMPQVINNSRGGGPIEILASRAIGQRKNLLLVRARDKTLLLGVTPQAIQFLAEIDQDPGTWQEVAMESGLPVEPERPSGGTTSLMGNL